MKYAWQVRRKPDGQPVSGAGLRLRDLRDRSVIATIAADSNGVATYETNGHLVPFSVETVDTPGGVRIWRSDACMAQGVISPMELPILFDAMTEGAIAGLEVDVGEATVGNVFNHHTVVRLSLLDGTALVGGVPVVCRKVQKFDLERPSSATRIDRMVARLHPAGASETPGFARFAILTGVEGDPDPPALTQTSDVREIGLYTIPVPVSGPVVPEDERPALFEGILYHSTTVQARFTLASASASVGATILSEDITLPAPGGYSYEAGASAYQDAEAGLEFEDSIGSYGTGNGKLKFPTQVGLRDDGDLWVADTGNNRAERFTIATGAYVSKLTVDGIAGLAVNPSNNHLLTLSNSGLYNRWNASGGHAVTDVDLGGGTWTQLACDGTAIYAVRQSSNRIYKRDLDGAAVTNWGGTGSGDGQLNGPYGIATDGVYVAVSETLNGRVSLFTVAGVFVAKWSVSGTPRGIALVDDVVWVTGSDGTVRSYDLAGTPGITINPSGTGDLNDPHALAVDGDVLYIADRLNNTIKLFTVIESGYGGIALTIDGFSDFSGAPYVSIGDRSGLIELAAWNANGPGGTATLALLVQPTSGTVQLRNIVAWFRAIPIR